MNGGLNNTVERTIRKVKLANEARNNTVALADDAELTLPVAANAVYQVGIFLLVRSPTVVPGVNFQYLIPAGADGNLTGLYYNIALVLGVVGLAQGVPLVLGATAGFFIVGYRGTGVLVTGGTAGNLKVQWAQSVATVEDTLVGKGSALTLLRLI